MVTLDIFREDIRIGLTLVSSIERPAAPW